MKNLPILLFLLFTNALFSQYLNIPNGSFSSTSEIPCPYDENTTITAADSWLIYQTLDNEWDGEVDSSICINVSQFGFSKGIELSQIDPTRALFIRSEIFNNPVPSTPNSLYNLYYDFGYSQDLVLNHSDTCANGICSGLMLGFESPDFIPDQTTLRERWFGVTNVTNNGWGPPLCIATENFEYYNLKEIVFKFTFENDNLDEHFVKAINIYIENINDFDVLPPELTTSNSSNGVFNLYLSNFYYDTMVPYYDTTYPSAQNISYIDVSPEPNSTEQRTINLYSGWPALVFQPFTAFRAGLVEGSDSVRHILNFINTSSDFCSFIVDQPFDPGSIFEYHSGSFSFANNQGCLSFRPGSALVIADNAEMQYGNNGYGVLNMQPASTIKIGKNSTLQINNKLWMFGKPREGDPIQVYMELNPGSTLIFGETARISNVNSRSADCKLNIYMNGGTLDIANLDDHSRSLVNLIYPTPSNNLSQNITVSPNPFLDYLEIKIITDSAENIELEWYTANGQWLKSSKETTEKGVNFLQLDVADFNPGIYFLTIKNSSGKTVEKLMKF